MIGVAKRGAFGALFALCMAAGTAGAQDAAAPTPEDVKNYLGTWAMTGDFNGNPLNVDLDLFDEKGTLTGLFSMALARQALAVEDFALKDEGLALTYDLKFGPQAFTVDMVVKVEGDDLTGKLADRSGLMKLDLTGKRGEKTFPPAFASELPVAGNEGLLGWWELSVEMRGQKIPATLVLADAGGKIGALVNTAFAPVPEIVRDITKSGDSLALVFSAGMGGQTLTFTLQVSRDGDGVKGTFGDTNGLLSAEFTGVKGEPNETMLARAHFAAVKREAETAASGSVAQTGPRDIRATVAGKTLRLRYDGVPQESDDYTRVASLKAGEVVSFLDNRCIKLFTELDLVFGDTVVKTANLAPDYPGVYGLWIKKTADGWELVFNKYGDVWGTQYDPSVDEAAVPLTYTKLAEPVAAFRAGVDETATGGALKFAWGEHEWTADFAVGK